MDTKSRLSNWYWRLTADHTQDRAIVRFLRRAGATPDWNILDVGCGYGRNLNALRAAGLRPTGVEVNPQIAAAVREAGFACHAPDDPAMNDTAWDAILMSHIVEHFDYRSLFEMMNRYLSILRPDGFLLIATPLLGDRFYDNFDHVKPYTPIAIEEVFGRRGLQVQFQAASELELVDLWIRRRPWCLRLFRSLLRRQMTPAKLALYSVNVALALAHRASFRLLGVADGWVGLYRKLG